MLLLVECQSGGCVHKHSSKPFRMMLQDIAAFGAINDLAHFRASNGMIQSPLHSSVKAWP